MLATSVTHRQPTRAVAAGQGGGPGPGDVAEQLGEPPGEVLGVPPTPM
ncbi:hypothetical protein [Streptomyces sp. NPDC050804]